MARVQRVDQRSRYGLGAVVLAVVGICGVLQNRSLVSTTVGQRKTSTNDTSLSKAAAPVSSYMLARTESLGFFQDITEENWKRYQTRARNEIIYSEPRPPKGMNSAMWLLKNVDPIFTCPHVRRVGGRGDGPKWTCDPHRLLERPDCLVYSIGSKGAYLFEDGLVKEVGTHCEIHVFDPDPSYARKNDPERNNIHYHGWGLMAQGETDPGSTNGKFEGLLFYSLPQIMEKLGHTGRTIDVFKIDCEGCEKTSFMDWVSTSVDVRQILIETHFSLPYNVTGFFDRFLDHGFAPFSKEANSHPFAKPAGVLFEWGFVRLHTDFLQRKNRVATN